MPALKVVVPELTEENCKLSSSEGVVEVTAVPCTCSSCMCIDEAALSTYFCSSIEVRFRSV